MLSLRSYLMKTLALMILLGVLTGCQTLSNRNWPKFWEEKNPGANLVIAEFPEYTPGEIPGPIVLHSPDDAADIDPNSNISIEEVPIDKDDAEKAVVPAQLRTIYFAYNSSVLTPQMEQRLAENATWILSQAKDRKIIIEGHCDERGSKEYNMSLGHNRAASVRGALFRLGVNPGQMTTISYGEDRPVDPGHDEDAWAKNRRVQFLVH